MALMRIVDGRDHDDDGRLRWSVMTMMLRTMMLLTIMLVMMIAIHDVAG